MSKNTVTRLDTTPQNTNPARFRSVAFLLIPRRSRQQRFVAWLRRIVRAGTRAERGSER